MIEVPEYADLIGKPFMDRARGPEAYSCMGLVLEIYKRAGLPMIDPEIDEEGAEKQWEIIEEPPWESMDVFVFVRPGREIGGHVGIYLGDGMLFQSVENWGCIESPLKEFPLELDFAYRWLN